MKTAPQIPAMKSLKSLISLLPVGLLLAGVTILPTAKGQTNIYSNGFETSGNFPGGTYSTTGGTGGTGTISGQGTDGGAVGNWTATFNSGTAQIVTNSTRVSTSMNPASGSQMLQAQYGTNASLSLNQVILATNNAIKEDFNFTFKLAVQEDTVSNAGVLVGIRSSAATSANNPNGMDFGLLRYVTNGTTNYGFAARQSDPGGSSYFTRIGTNTANLNEWYTFSLDLDWSSLTYNGTVKDSNNSLVTSFTNVAIWDRNNVMTNYGFNQLGVYVHQVGNRPYFLVDDMSVTLVPEPTTLALVLLGLVAVIYFRRHGKTA